jgi:hypothetical protein
LSFLLPASQGWSQKIRPANRAGSWHRLSVLANALRFAEWLAKTALGAEQA